MCHTRTLYSRKQRDGPFGSETFRDKQKHGAPGHNRQAGAGQQTASRRGEIRARQEQAGAPPTRRAGDKGEIRRTLPAQNEQAKLNSIRNFGIHCCPLLGQRRRHRVCGLRGRIKNFDMNSTGRKWFFRPVHFIVNLFLITSREAGQH